MSAIVRIFSHAELVNARVSTTGGGAQMAYSVLLLSQPYLGGEVLTATTGSAVSSDAATAPAKTSILHIEVQAGSTVHYEVTPQSQTARTATTSSPTVSGHNNIAFGPGWTLSVLEATNP